MSASQSNLSDPHFGYDLVVAVTQASINTTMKQLMAGLTSPEVVVCYVYDDSNNLVPIDYATLKTNAKGSDPFAVPNGSNPATNTDLINLTAANFAGGVKAQLGLPDLPLANLPNIVTLGAGTSAPVLFNLLCSEFVVSGFVFGPRGSSTWINQAQPSGSGNPWYFAAHVFLNSDSVDPNSKVPQAVRDRIIQLQAKVQNAFSIQKLFLDLDSKIPLSSPTIQGVPVGWPVWSLINQIFLDAYFGQLGQNGDPVLNYSFTLNSPRATTLQLGAIAKECDPLLANGAPIQNPTSAQQNAGTLVYLGTQTTTTPTPVPFPWNWMELADVTAFSGVQAVRRDVFLTYLLGLVSADAAHLCVDTSVTMTHSGEEFQVGYNATPSSSPGTFVPSAIGPAGSDGFTTVATINFNHASHAEDSDPIVIIAGIWGDYNYSLTGTLAFATNQIRVQVEAKAFMMFAHREVFVNYTDLEGANYYDKVLTVVYDLGVAQDGALQVTQTSNVVDKSVPWNFVPRGILGGTGAEDEVKGGLTSIETWLAHYVDSAFTTYVSQMTNTINGYNAWVFAGNDAFTFKNISFSTGLDLVAQLTYVNPN